MFFDEPVFQPDKTLDFHYFGKVTEYDVERILNEFIEDSYNTGAKFLLVITGKGAFIKPRVKRFLKQNNFVESFNQAGYFTGQGGAFEVILAK